MPRILLIDDDEAVRRATTLLLQAKGFEVVPAPDGKTGLDTLTIASFDLAIVDLFMPGMDGLATMKAIREAHPRLPIIAVSGFMLRGETQLEMPNFGPMAAEAGADATLYKPFRPAELIDTIHNVLAVEA